MTCVINQPCIGAKDVSCTEVCPVDCIHPTPDEPGFTEAEQLYIDPEECIDCDACVEACPVDAIGSEDHVLARVAALLRQERSLLRGAPAMNDHASDTTSRRLADDRGYGIAMFLIVTGAVALLALVGSWWMLGVAFAVHVAMTALVTLTIVGAMSGRGFAISDSPDFAPQEPRLGSQPPARSEAVTAL